MLRAIIAMLCVCAFLMPAKAAEDSRRREFAEAMVKALRNFEELYPQDIQITVVEPEKGKYTVEVRGADEHASARLQEAMGMAVANLALRYPGIRYVALEDGGWRIILPANISIPAEGDFGLEFQK